MKIEEQKQQSLQNEEQPFNHDSEQSISHNQAEVNFDEELKEPLKEINNHQSKANQNRSFQGGNSFLNALLKQYEKYPQTCENIKQIFKEHHETALKYLAREDHKSMSNSMDSPQETYTFPLFSQLTDKIKQTLGFSEFRQFMGTFISSQEQNQKIKEEMSRLEKEVLTIEARESEKFENYGLTMPKEPNQTQLFCHSSLSKDIEEEFKEAKWIVLTSPTLQKLNQKSPLLTSRDPSLGPTSSNNPLPSLNPTFSNSNQSQANNSFKLQNQPPQKRYGHSASLVKNKMYIFGGLASQQKGGNLQTFYECQLKFNNDNSGVLFQWDKIKADTPRARDSHTCIHVGDALIMFGGSGGQSSFNDLFKFDLRQQKWSKLEPQGEMPAPREGHIAKQIGRDRMLIHGGVDQYETSFDDTYILTGISQFMDSTQQTSIFSAEVKQSSTPYQNQMYENQIQVGSFDTNSTMPTASVIKNQVLNQNNQGKLRWYKCIQEGIVPQGRDSHSSAWINNKIYIFGGQGDGDMIFDDLYSVEIIEQVTHDGQLQFVSKWEQIEPQTPNGQSYNYKKPCARTSHTCTVYKNRYLIIIGGETEVDPLDIRLSKPGSLISKSNGGQKSKIKFDDITIEIDQESSSEQDLEKSQKNSEQNEEFLNHGHTTKKTLNDVWVYDTLMRKWNEIKAPFKIQGPLAGKKIKRQFEPRMAHSAVQLNQFVIIFGGLGSDQQLVSNDLYVLSLDGYLGGLSGALDQLSEQKQNTPVPEVQVFERVQSAPNSVKMKPTKTLKLTNPSDRNIMSGHILNQIINFNNNQTNQFFLNGNQILNNCNNTNNIFSSNMNQQDLFNSQRIVLRNDCQVQTVESEQEVQNQELARKQQVIMIMQQNEFKMKNFQRTKISFIKSLAQDIQWPLQCFGAFIDNSIQSYEFSKMKLEQSKNQQQSSSLLQSISNSMTQVTGNGNTAIKQSMLDIEINMKIRGTKQSTAISGNTEDMPIFNGSDAYIEIKDNGHGMHPKHLMEALTSFGTSNLLKFKSSQNMSEHGIGLKINSLRLASSTLIITKTRPVIEYGCSTSFLSIALLSTSFLKDSGSSHLVAPLVSFEIRNKRISKKLTPQSEHFLDIIAKYTQSRFTNGEELQIYAVNMMGEHGTHIFMFDLHKHKVDKNNGNELEIGTNTSDIILNPKLHDFKKRQLECSLRSYLRYLYVEYPEYVKITLNGEPVNLTNPYSKVKKDHPSAFVGDKTDRFAIQMLCEDQLQKSIQALKNISDVKVEESETNVEMTQNNNTNKVTVNSDKREVTNTLIDLQGILIYRGNRLIRRFETCFGEDEDSLVSQQMISRLTGEENNFSAEFIFKKNAIVSVFKSRSTTNLQKSDLSEKTIMKMIKEWFKQKEASILEEKPNGNHDKQEENGVSE